jgi:hypothetical protein
MLAIVGCFCAFIISCTASISTEPKQGGGESRAETSVSDWKQWELLGERRVDSNSRADHDTVEVGRREGRFSQLAIRVENSRIELYDMVVTFTDGERYSLTDTVIFNANTTSRIIHLPGDPRTIAKVDFWYRDLPGGGRAIVQLYGR